MAKGTLAIRRQIRSITNTKKMTKAMEMVSAAKMKRSVDAVLATRPYGTAVREILEHLMPGSEGKRHPYMTIRNGGTIGIIVVATNRGLCGGFNTIIAQKVLETIAHERKSDIEGVELYTFGKRGRDFLVRYGKKIFADFKKADITTSVLDILPLMHLVSERFLSGAINKVILVYMDFISSARQRPIVHYLLPLQRSDDFRKDLQADVLYEPSNEFVMNTIIPCLLESQVYQAVLESEASEHSSRMMAMHNASEAATDMLLDLRLTYNQIRQAGITQEIAEITAGRAAIE